MFDDNDYSRMILEEATARVLYKKEDRTGAIISAREMLEDNEQILQDEQTSGRGDEETMDSHPDYQPGHYRSSMKYDLQFLAVYKALCDREGVSPH